MNKDGKEIWQRTLKNGDGTGGMFVTHKALYFGLNGTGKIYVLYDKTGEIFWTKQVGTATGGFIEGLTLSWDGIIYAVVIVTDKHQNEL